MKRNRIKRGYSAAPAQAYANERKERFKRKRKFTERMRKHIVARIEEEQWSAEQIVGEAKARGIPMVSTERIYQYIRQDRRSGGTLWKHCRHRLKHRKRPVGGKKVVIPGKVSIEKRPDIINEKKRFGDWEIDTVVGQGNRDAILTATERQTGFLLMKKLPEGKNAKTLARELYRMFLPYKKYVRSFTSDNGTEFYEHRQIANMLKTQYYFAHPYSSRERGLNEYIRTYPTVYP